ncbi:MAG: hypothetical protein JXR48_07340 [Candidatus Delongbacteria bacterium]|nr:hypothetical protein [Candidatus Delongbacteria bacterium]MBN2834765.1 hypothetical protein [Candidatus Delongbacteria bacterium]
MKKLLALLLIFVSLLKADFTKIEKFLPNSSLVQFAGNLGFISTGFGYHFLNQKVETCFYYGYLPKSMAGTDIHQFTLKSSYTFMKRRLDKQWNIYFLNSISVIYSRLKNTYTIWPEYYPDGYYFANSIHTQINFGFQIKKRKIQDYIDRLSYVVEFGLLDMQIYYMIKSEKPNMFDYLNCSLGLKFELTDSPFRKKMFKRE